MPTDRPTSGRPRCTRRRRAPGQRACIITDERMSNRSLLGTFLVVGHVLLSPCAAPAMSCSGWITAWPPSNGVGVPLNARIVLDGTYWPSTVVSNLEAHRPVLRSRLEEVPLVVEDVYRARQGAFTQVVLAPVRRLSPWTRYTLGFRRHPPGYARESETLDAVSFSWTTGTSVAVSPPAWTGVPFICDARYSSWGGDFSEARITVAVPVIRATAPVRVLAELDTYDARYHALYPMQQLLPVDDGVLTLASGACLGPFYLETDVRYFASLTAVDVAGNRARWQGSLAFRVPDGPPPESYEVIVEPLETPVRDSLVPYPAIARKAGVSGTVHAELEVCPDGSVEQVEVVASSPLLDAAVVGAASCWMFEPSTEARRVPVTVRFLVRRPVAPPPDWRW